jgi:large subunit ribosomal protein L13
MKTYLPKKNEMRENWYIVDASGKTLGRLASQIAAVIRGKHQPTYTPHMDMRNFVVVINAQEVEVTGRKSEQKKYYRHSGYPGGIKSTDFSDMMEHNPEKIISIAVKGMLPHNKLGRVLGKHLKVYRDSQHPHEAQKPVKLEF